MPEFFFAPPTPLLKVDLTGRRVLVTGSTRGIGREIALSLGTAGADVIVHGRNRRGRGVAVCQELTDLGIKNKLICGNVANQKEVDGIFQAIQEAWGGVDILINNAASGRFEKIEGMKNGDWQHTLDVSLSGAFRMAQGAASLMSGWGRIINISSLGSQRYLPNYGAMAAAKAGLEALTRTLAVELRPKGIVVNALSMGPIQTNIQGYAPEKFPKRVAEHQKKSPSGRVGLPSDLTPIIRFLCSDAAQWIVGQTLIADGGYVLH